MKDATNTKPDPNLYRKLKFRALEAKRVATRILHANNAGVVVLTMNERTELVEIMTGRYVSAPQKQFCAMMWLRVGASVVADERASNRRKPARTQAVDAYLDELVGGP